MLFINIICAVQIQSPLFVSMSIFIRSFYIDVRFIIMWCVSCEYTTYGLQPSASGSQESFIADDSCNNPLFMYPLGLPLICSNNLQGTIILYEYTCRRRRRISEFIHLSLKWENPSNYFSFALRNQLRTNSVNSRWAGEFYSFSRKYFHVKRKRERTGGLDEVSKYMDEVGWWLLVHGGS